MSSAFDRTKRQNMTLHVSRDDGRTWAPAARVWPGPAAYSSVVDAGAGGGAGDVVGLLFEKGDAGPYEQIAYVSVPL
jgi:sialidase-1